MMEANKGRRKEFNIVPLDFDCNLLGPSSSGGSSGSILGPSRLEAEGDLLVCWFVFLVVDGLEGFAVVFADFVGFAFALVVVCTGLAEDDCVVAMKASIFSFDSLQLETKSDMLSQGMKI